MEYVTSDLIDEFTENYTNKIKAKFALIRAFNTLPRTCNSDKKLLFKFAKNYMVGDDEIVGAVLQKKNKIKNENARKLILGGTKNTELSFWNFHNAMELAKDDTMFPMCQPKGKYQLVKEFLKSEWKSVSKFKIKVLNNVLCKKFPDLVTSSDNFGMQRWQDAYFYSDTEDVATKPLWKKLNRIYSENIFYEPKG